MKQSYEDMRGRRFGRLVTREPYRVPEGQRTKAGWLCQCDCGQTKAFTNSQLRHGHVVSCGCARMERAATINQTHGMSKKGGAYKSWCSMIRRCTNPNAPSYEHYGGRGIRVCDRWKAFEAFYEDMGPRPEGYSIERLDVSGNYEPENCTWVPYFDQSKNRRTSRYVRLNGEVMIQAEAARRIGQMPQTLNKWRHEPSRIPAHLDLVLTLCGFTENRNDLECCPNRRTCPHRHLRRACHR